MVQKVQFSINPIENSKSLLVTKYINGTPKSKKIFPPAKFTTVFKRISFNNKLATGGSVLRNHKSKIDVINGNVTDKQVQESEQKVIVSDNTGMVQYLKAGFFLTAGTELFKQLFSGLSDMFNGD